MLRKEWMWERSGPKQVTVWYSRGDTAGHSAFHEDAPASQTQQLPANKPTQRFFPSHFGSDRYKRSSDFELGFIQTPGPEVQGCLEHRQSAWDGLNVTAAWMDQLPALNTAF